MPVRACVCVRAGVHVQNASLWSSPVHLPLTGHTSLPHGAVLSLSKCQCVGMSFIRCPSFASPLSLRTSSVSLGCLAGQRHHCLVHDCSPEWRQEDVTEASGHNISMFRSWALPLSLPSPKQLSQEMVLTEIEEFNTCLTASLFAGPPEGAAETKAGRGSKLPGQRSRGWHRALANLESTVTQAHSAAVMSNSAVQACH